MPLLRRSSALFAGKSTEEIRGILALSVYESSVFEGARLRKHHPVALLAKASRKKSTSGSYSQT